MVRTAIVHDNFAQMGGAERVAESIHRMLPTADLISSLAVPPRLSPQLQRATIRTTWMQHLPRLDRYYRHYFMLYPLAMETLDLSEYDLVISSCFGYAKGIKKRRGALHVCYCHTPMRWVWRYEDYAEREQFSVLSRGLLPPLLAALKRWDLRASRRPDYFIANSTVVAQRISKFYGRDAIVIPPPIDTARFQLTNGEGTHYLVLSRLVAYKRLHLAVEACSRLQRPLLVVGDGPDRARLERLAGPTVRFMGRLSDAEVNRVVAGARALLFPGEEDFGMAPLEINASGRPVICFRGGGATETVIDGLNGVFFNEPTADSLAKAIREFESRSWHASRIREYAQTFDVSVFSERLRSFLNSVSRAELGYPVLGSSAAYATGI